LHGPFSLYRTQGKCWGLAAPLPVETSCARRGAGFMPRAPPDRRPCSLPRLLLPSDSFPVACDACSTVPVPGGR